MDTAQLNNFKKALKFTLKWEGGYVFDPDDPGGETKWGISKKAYPNLDIKNLSAEQAADIYAKDYWEAAGCGNMGWPLSAATFDSAVNCGVSRAKAWSNGTDDYKTVLSRRRDYYVDLINKNSKMIKYANGWWNRMADLKRFCDSEVANVSN